MKIECATCHKTYNILESKLPVSKKQFALPCPNCDSLISVDLQSDLENIRSTQPQIKETNEIRKSGLKTSQPKKPVKGKRLREGILSSLQSLPAMPQVVLKAQQIMKNPKLGVSHLAEVIEKDPALVINILKTANSAYYGIPQDISSIQNATALLGNTVVEEIISMSIASGFLDRTLEGYTLESRDMWKHSLAVAFGSRFIANKKLQGLENDAFLAGLLHDVGKIILDKYILERKEMFDEFLDDGNETFLSAESSILGFDHSQIGFQICKTWGIPDALITAIRFHHYPSRSNQSKLAYVVHMADCISMLSGFGSGSDSLLYQMEQHVLEFLGLQEKDVYDTMCQAVEAVQKTEESMPTK